MTTAAHTTTLKPADQLAAAYRLRDLFVRRIVRDNLDPQHRTYRALVTVIQLIRDLNQPIPAEQEAHALIAQERQGSYD
jgi:hypothetical protein